VEARQFGFGDILREAGALIGAHAGYLAGVTLFVAAGYIALDLATPADASGIPSLIVGVVVQYFVVERLLADRLPETRRRRFGALLIASLLSGLGIIAGFILLVVPGLLLAAGWSAVAPFVVVDGKGGMAALGESWRVTARSRWAIVLVLLVTYAPAFAAIMAFAPAPELAGLVPDRENAEIAATEISPGSPLIIVVTDITVSALSTWGWLLGAAIYNLAVPVRERFEEVFG
jgi:hypothetical protein